MVAKLDEWKRRLEEDPVYRAETHRIADVLVRHMLESLVAHGQIDPKDKTEEQIRAEFVRFARQNLQSGIRIAVDHTESLRSLASKLQNDGKPWVAVMLYATWVEHVLNGLISSAMHRRGDAEAAKQIIRDVSVNGKLTWLLPLLGYSRISSTHASRLAKLADFRNQFVHYKWTYVDPDNDKNGEDELVKFLGQCKATFKYLAHYKTTQALSKSKAKLHRAVRRKIDS